MKLRAPEGCSTVSHGGQILIVDADGSLDVDDDVAVLAGLNRSALFALLREKGVRITLPVTNAQLRAAASRALAEGM
jgi:hypothetical protein